jgi:hypothetical protein
MNISICSMLATLPLSDLFTPPLQFDTCACPKNGHLFVQKRTLFISTPDQPAQITCFTQPLP